MYRRQFLAAAPLALGLATRASAQDSAICIRDGLAIGGPTRWPISPTPPWCPANPRIPSCGAALSGNSSGPTRWRPSNGPDPLLSQYGGFCANAMSHGVLSPGHPAAWLVHGGALYLCSSPLALRRFARDIDASIAAAQANWPALQEGRARITTS